MLKVNRKVEYGLIAIKHLSQVSPQRLVPAREIVDHYGIPAAPLAHVLGLLSQKGLIDSIQGAKGGYRLQPQVTQINFSEFIEMLTGEVAFTDCQKEDACACSLIPQCNIVGPMHAFNKRLKHFLQSITLGELIMENRSGFISSSLQLGSSMQQPPKR